jgi:hypothetical protein
MPVYVKDINVVRMSVHVKDISVVRMSVHVKDISVLRMSVHMRDISVVRMSVHVKDITLHYITRNLLPKDSSITQSIIHYSFFNFFQNTIIRCNFSMLTTILPFHDSS